MSLTYNISGGDKYAAALQKIVDLKVGVRAGIPAGATTTDGKSIPEYAVYNELGTSRMPARPFMRQTVNDRHGDWVDIVARSLNYDEISRNQAKSAMGLCGVVMEAHVKQTIQQGEFLPDAPATVEAKRRKGKVEPDHPLIDTGQMLAAVTNEVVSL